MERRAFVVAIAGCVAALPLVGRGQAPAKVYRVGMLESIPAAQNAANLDALRAGLRELGYVEGRNLVIEYVSSDGDADRLHELAGVLVRHKSDVIIARGTPAAMHAKSVQRRIPVLMMTMGDPRTIVASFAHPGGSVTGITTFSTELTAKRIEILRELVPGLARIGLLHNLGNPAAVPEWEETRKAAHALGLQAELLDVRSEDDIGRALDRAARQRVEAIVVGADGLTQMHEQAIVALIGRRRLPAAYPARAFVEAGGLFAYAVRYPDLYYRLASYVDRILKGADPASIPIEQPTRFELVVNLKTAKALGIAVPQSVLLRADDVLQ
jgi:putative ABC transport system substrate-binding protein